MKVAISFAKILDVEKAVSDKDIFLIPRIGWTAASVPMATINNKET